MASITIPREDFRAPSMPATQDLLRWSVDHKIIGIQYMVFAFVMFLVGGALAMGIRAELLTPELDFMSSGASYNNLFTMHGSIMIFFWIMPVFAGFGNYVVPLQLGAKDMAFPWLNAFAFWLLPPSAFLMLASYFVGSPEAGWTAYPPLSIIAEYTGDGQVLWALSIHVIGISSIAGGINFVVTILNMRPPEMTIWRMPLFCWAMLATSIIQVMATPFLTGGLLLLLLDRIGGTSFFNPAEGGDVLLYQNVFWFYSHPAVYIMVLPGMGLLSDVLAVHARKPVFGYRMIGLSSMAIALIGFMVWAHHMFTSLQPELRIPFMITSMIIAVPTGIKIFGWIGTIWGGKIRFTGAMLFALGFLSMFVIGGISGVMLAAIPFDIHVHDTYFVVSHFHFVLFGGSVFAIYAGFYHWFPKITGKMLDERLAKLHFALTYIGFLGTFFPQHFVGLLGMPRRVAVYDPAFQQWNVLISLFGFLLGISTLVFVYNVGVSLASGKIAGANPWRALTLEWATTSPPPAWNFDEDPIPFEDPYGYGSKASVAYLDAIDRTFGVPEADAPARPGGALRVQTTPAGD